MKKKLICLSLFNCILPEGRVSTFLDNSDSLWTAFDHYGASHNLETEQVFTIAVHQMKDNKLVEKKENTSYVFFKKRPLYVLLHLAREIRDAMIVQLNNESLMDFFVGCLAKLTGSRVVMFYHNDVDPRQSKLPRPLLRFFRDRVVDAYMTNALGVKRKFKTELNQPIFHFKFGYDPKLFYPIERSSASQLRILYCGSISPRKKLDDLIRGIAASKFRDRMLLTMVGEDCDPNQAYLNALKSMLARDGIHWSHVGFVPHSQIIHHFHDADVFVNMRPDEAFGKVFVEAMATGLPIIGRKGSPGPEDLIRNGDNGFLVDSPAMLASVLDSLVDNTDLCQILGKNARSFVQGEYSLARSYESFERPYEFFRAGYFAEAEFFQRKPLSFLRRIKRIVMNQRNDRCDHALSGGKVMDAEQQTLIGYCRGKGIDVGCGSNKTHPDAIGVDITAKGTAGKFGNQMGETSSADICASGDDLHMFGDGELDYVVARHNLEHYQDTIKTLREWKRVVRHGGIIGIVIPDDTWRDTIHLDPTHYHVFTPQSFQTIVELIGGLKILKLETCVEDWSFVCVMEKVQ
jgi:glycosyltransferase involved in cell wall biosynthesis